MKSLIFAMAFPAVLACAAENPAVEAVNHLGLATLRLTKGNALVSPWSLQQSLVMVYAGARGQTQTEMAAALGYKGDVAALHEAFKGLREALAVTDPSLKDIKPLRSANRLFVDQRIGLKAGWLQLTRDFYDAGPEKINLTQSAESEKAINAWVSGQTEGKIPRVIPPGALGPIDGLSPLLVLVNALYFDMPWDERFTKELTADAPFYLAAGRSKTVPLMFKQHRQRYAHRDGFQIATLPYAGGAMQFVVILPDDANDFADIEKALTPHLLTECAALPKSEVRLWLPRLKLEPPARAMKDDLKKLGMKAAFSGEADLSGMLEADAYVGEVFHRAFLEMDEDGTKAAAATASIIRPKNGVPHEVPHESVRADHPFIFLIQHVPSGTCLFIGRVTDAAPDGALEKTGQRPKKK